MKKDKEEVSERKLDEKTNYVLDKFSEVGIEVVTDKKEFDRILENQAILQIMKKNDSVEELFLSKNEENLDFEIDKVTINDVNLYNSYINISKTTPFIFKEFGLDEYPVNIYKQKLARALFLEKEKYGERLTHGHKGEFTDKEVKEVFKNIGNPRYIFNSKHDINNPENFYLIGVYDTFDKQGNPMMLSLHYNKNRKEIEANWVTAVYGKNANILVNDWTRKGYLVYKNDLEIEKASEEVVALYMRVSNLHEAYKENIKLKSNYVNNEGVFFFHQNNTIYGFTHNGKIYLNPDVMTSEAAVHEYTHLWDGYIQKTNPELWNKGMNIFKGTSLWNEIVSDENYAGIKDDENLVLSECHACICGKIADAVLQRVLEHDGDLKKTEMVSWDTEVLDYVYENFKEIYSASDVSELSEFLASPMKDLFQYERNLKLESQVKKKPGTRIEKVPEHSPEDDSVLVTRMKTEKVKVNIIIKGSCDIVPYLQVFAKSEVENFGVVILDGGNKVKEIRSVSVGTINRSLLHAREVFKEAIRGSAGAVIFFHNHPSGAVEPSSEDISTTQNLMKVSKIIGIPVLDHIIVSEFGYFSFYEHDLLNEKKFGKDFDDELVKALEKVSGSKPVRKGKSKSISSGMEM